MKSQRALNLRLGTPKHQLDKFSATPGAKSKISSKFNELELLHQDQKEMSSTYAPMNRLQESPVSKRFIKSKTPLPESANLKTSTNKRFLNKTPYPTNFSNKKSQNYLSQEGEEEGSDFRQNYGIGNYTSNQLQRQDRVPGLALSSILERKTSRSKGALRLNDQKRALRLDPSAKTFLAESYKSPATAKAGIGIPSGVFKDGAVDTGSTIKTSTHQSQSSQNILGNTMPSKLLSTKLSKPEKINQKILTTNYDYDSEFIGTGSFEPLDELPDHLPPQKHQESKQGKLYSSASKSARLPENTQFKSSGVGNKKTVRSSSSTRMQSKSHRDPNQRHLINLQNVLFIEDKLWGILDKLRKNEAVVESCQHWWDLNKNDAISTLDRLFRDEKTRRGLRQALILEILSIGLTHFICTEENVPPGVFTHIKNMMFYQHQNFLIIIDFILHRLPPQSSQNVWAHALQALVANKRSRKLKKNQNVNALRQNNEIISNFIKTICRMINKKKASPSGELEDSKEQQFPKPIYTTVAGILRQIQKCQVSRARELVLRALDASLFKAENEKKDHFLPPISAEGTMVREETEVGGVGDHHTLEQIAAHGGGGTALGANADPDKLPQVFPPFLPKLTEQQKKKDTFTLVLDLDETLVHYFEVSLRSNQIQGEGHFLVRPGAQKFLMEMSKIYELVIFTAAMQDYADCVLDQMDSKRYISYRLYRQHALPYGNIFVKDLSRLGRDLSRVIIVDNVAQNFQLQPDNGIFIRSWFDDPEDTALEELAPLLKEVVKKKLDVRLALKKFRDQMLDQISRGITNPKLSLDDTANSIEA